MADERGKWDRKYSESSHDSSAPDPLLVHAYEDFIQPLFPQPGTALDLAGGLGRHAIWLAERGWRVKLVDISEVGIARARELAGNCVGQINYEVADLTAWTAAGFTYDLVLVFFYLQRDLFPELVNALRPGGLLIYKTYTHVHPKFGKGPTHPMHLLDYNELLRAFPGLRVLHYEETIRDRGVAELVAQKAGP